jgi:hypothetical protein
VRLSNFVSSFYDFSFVGCQTCIHVTLATASLKVLRVLYAMTDLGILYEKGKEGGALATLGFALRLGLFPKR